MAPKITRAPSSAFVDAPASKRIKVEVTKVKAPRAPTAVDGNAASSAAATVKLEPALVSQKDLAAGEEAYGVSG